MTGQVVTVNVQYVDEPKPGKKNWSIKDDKGNRYSLPAALAPKVRAGSPVSLRYEDREYEGRWFKMVLDVYDTMPTPSPAPSAQPQLPMRGNGTAAMDPGPTPERIFICGALNAWIRSTPSTEVTEASIMALVNMLRRVYRATFGNPGGAPF